MPTITIDMTELARTTGLEASDGVFDFWPYAPVVVDDQDRTYLINENALRVRTVNGLAEVDLPVTAAGNGLWVHGQNYQGGRQWLVQVGASAESLWKLVELDPDTLDPRAPASPAWLAGLAAVQGELVLKADVDALEVVAGQVVAKADQSDLEVVAAEVATKVDAADVSANIQQALEDEDIPAQVDTGVIAGVSPLAANLARLTGKMRRGVEDASALIISDSTYQWIPLLAQSLATAHPAWTVRYVLWNVAGSAYGAPTVIHTGTGPRTITLYAAAAPGETTWYFLGAKWAAAIAALDPDVVFVNMGHNEGSSAGGTTAPLWRGQYIALTESLAEQHPETGLVLILQNPETDNVDQQVRARVYEDIAAQRGYGVLPVLDAFLAQPNWDTALMTGGVDKVHPNTAGYQFWADTIARYFADLPAVRGGSVTPSGLILPGQQLLTNGSFTAFASAAPDSMTLVNATTSKDTTNYESANGYSVRLQAASAAASRIYGQLSAAQVRALRGRSVTLAVRLRVPAGAPNTVGRVSLHDGVQAEIRSRSMQSPPVDGFVWRVVTMKVSASATFLQANVYGDSAANATADVSIDSMHLVRGVLPRRAM